MKFCQNLKKKYLLLISPSCDWIGLDSCRPGIADSLLIGEPGPPNLGDPDGRLGPPPVNREGFLGDMLDLRLNDPISMEPLIMLSYCMPSSFSLSMVLL